MKMNYNTIPRTNWTKGHIGGDLDGYDFCIKHFDEVSTFGINNGRISKLEMRIGGVFSPYGKIVANYDRGWDIEVREEARAAYEEILEKFN